MFFVLSKILFYVVMPLTWILALLLFAVFTKKENKRKRAVLVATLLLVFFTNPFLINEAWLWWERPPTPVNKVQPHDAAIILTGFTNQKKSPHDRIYSGKGADRVLHPLQLYKAGLVKKVIISGGSGSLIKRYSDEADEVKKILLQAGVPQENILVEDKSRNTHENAVNTKTVLLQHPELKSLLLVTSAFHMRRAEGCFKKAGIRADDYSTDFYSIDRSFTPDNLIVPQEVCLYHWQMLLHEILGYLVYRLMGYC